MRPTDIDRDFDRVPLPTSEVPRSQPGPTTTTTVSLRHTAASVLTGDRLAELIGPWVDEVRTALTESAGVPVPFPGREQAVAWIERVVRAQRVPSARNQRTARALYKQAMTALRRSAWIWRGEVSTPMIDLPRLVYYRHPRNAEPIRARVRLDSPLWPLVDAAHHISHATGFTESQVVMHILTGQGLELPPLQMFIHETFVARVGRREVRIHRQWATIEIATPEGFTEPGVRKLITRLRKHFGLTKKKGFSLRDAALRRIYRRIPRRPDERRVEYWRRVQTVCAQRGLRFGSPWKVKQAVERLDRRLTRTVEAPDVFYR